jgi:hypothetical protein
LIEKSVIKWQIKVGDVLNGYAVVRHTRIRMGQIYCYNACTLGSTYIFVKEVYKIEHQNERMTKLKAVKIFEEVKKTDLKNGNINNIIKFLQAQAYVGTLK